MKNSKKATSIVEAIVVMLIIVTGVTGMYTIYSESIKLSNSTANKIQAIQIATQGIESFTNIRDTNWKMFSGDYANCWNTLNYNIACIGATDIAHTIGSGNYIIFKNNNYKWELENKTTTDTFGNGTYITDFKVLLDSDGIYTQTGGITNSLKPIFTREIQISYTGSTGTPSDQKIIINSLVQWVDNSSSSIHKVKLKQILSNWKK